MQTSMKQKIFIIILSVAVVMSMVPPGACAAFAAKTGKTGCKESASRADSIIKPAAKTCHLTQCPAGEGQPFLLPGTSFRMPHNENRNSLLTPTLFTRPQNTEKPDLFESFGFAVKQPLPFRPPPLFSLNCVYIC
jgi:hypothetical protein